MVKEVVERATAEAAKAVEPATAETVDVVGPATADASKEGGAAHVEEAPIVEPALTYEEMMKRNNNNNDATTSRNGGGENRRNDDDMKGEKGTTTGPRNTDLSIEKIRSAMRVDFESIAAVLHGASPKNCLQILLPCIYDERDFISFGEVKKYIVIAEGTCYVYNEPTDTQPLYAVDLSRVIPIKEDRYKPDPESATISPIPQGGKNLPPEGMITINLKYKTTSKQAYQFTFDTQDDPGLDKRFMDVVDMASRQHARPETVLGEPIPETGTKTSITRTKV